MVPHKCYKALACSVELECTVILDNDDALFPSRIWDQSDLAIRLSLYGASMYCQRGDLTNPDQCSLYIGCQTYVTVNTVVISRSECVGWPM